MKKSERKRASRSLCASPEGIAKAELALMHKGWSRNDLQAEIGLSRQPIGKFFTGKPIERLNFREICEKLNLDWQEIAVSSVAVPTNEPVILEVEVTVEQSQMNQEQSGTIQALTAPVTGTTEQQATCEYQAIIVLSAKLTADNAAQFKDQQVKIEAFVTHLQTLVEDVSLTIMKIEPGSIKITLGGSEKGLKRLAALFNSGELTEVLGIPVEDVELTAEEDDETELENKFRLVREIRTQGAVGRDLSGVNLNGADLSGANLSGVNLSGANLSGADLIGANLRGADLSGAYLSGANLRGADLSGADLSGADLSGADLSGAYLIGADLSGAYLSGAYLIGAYLSGAYLIGANLIGADLSDANLIGANLIGANLRGAYLRGANLRGAYLSDAYLSDADLSGADLSGANLIGANLSDANLSGADLSDAYLIDAYLIGAYLRGANLSGAYLSGAYLSDPSLSGANLHEAKVKNVRFEVNLRHSESVRRNLTQQTEVRLITRFSLRRSFNLALVVTVTSAVIGFAGVALLFAGKTLEGSMAAMGGLGLACYCLSLLKDINDRLARIAGELNNDSNR
jgi:uncharacterized protein YjbI with pentapeptide repeats/DNA-binding Xre family transcriptional regulator